MEIVETAERTPFPSFSSFLPSFPFELGPLIVVMGLGVGLA